MSFENQSPEDKKEVTGKNNDVIQGDKNKFIKLIESIVSIVTSINLSVFHISFANASPLSSSQRRRRILNKKQSIFFLIVMLTFVIGGFIVPGIIYKDASKYPEISLGEEIIFDYNDQNNDQIKRLKEAFGNIFLKNYQEYRNLLTDYLKDNPNSPELWVYLNNVKATLLSKNPIKIAVSIPIGTNEDVAQEILRGVALAQHEINDDFHNGINGQFLQVIIANDDNDGKKATEVAKAFVNDPSILAVVGHNASEASLPAKNTYQGKLVMITPTSFASGLENSDYIFKMVPNIGYFVNSLLRHIQQENPNSTIATCLDGRTKDNSSFLEALKDSRKNFSLTIENKGSCGLPKSENVNTNNSDNKEMKEIIDNKEINGLLVAPYVNGLNNANELLRKIRDNKPSIRLYGSPTFFTDKTVQEGKAVEGLTISVPWYPNENEDDTSKENVEQLFKKKFEQVYKKSTKNWRTAMAYDATWIIATGLEEISNKKQKINRAQLNKALRGEDYPKFTYNGATGRTTFTDAGVNTNETDIIVKMQGSEFVLVSNQ